MNVYVRAEFRPPTEAEWSAMRSLAASLTDDPKSVRVSADATPNWLVAEFTMNTEPQYAAAPKIERAIRVYACNRWDSAFGFPYSAAERARADRRAAQRKARRIARRSGM
jgi:hypothetical protein